MSITNRSADGGMPLKIVQFGEGNFLRAFIDWMVQRLNEAALFHGTIRLVQPIPQGKCDEINARQGRYTVLLRGIDRGRMVRTVDQVTAIAGCVNPYENWERLVDDFRLNSLRFIVSNTTEAGILYQPEPYRPGACQISYPAKLTALMYERFLFQDGKTDKGLFVLPCELIEKNGDTLKKCVLRHAADWSLDDAFIEWLDKSNYFPNTLVDRIVTGFPGEEFDTLCQELGYIDPLLVCGESFHFFAIECPESTAALLEKELPLTQGGFNVLLTDDIAPYRDRKVRLLNGAHTATALAAHLAGYAYVDETVRDPLFFSYLKRLLFREILPGISLPDAEKQDYAESVLDRFANPFIKHRLLSISLNSVSKWSVRVLPSLCDYLSRTGELPPLTVFSLAALAEFYRNRDGFHPSGHRVDDSPDIVRFFEETWDLFERNGNYAELAERILQRDDFWGRDLTDIEHLAGKTAEMIEIIEENGIRKAVGLLCGPDEI